MLKKFFCAAFILATIVFGNVEVSAQDFWVNTENGIEYYVMDETFNNQTQYRNNRQFTVDVKLVRNQKADIKTFSFRENDGMIFHSIDGNERDFVHKGTAAYSIWEFGLKYLGIDYEVKYD